MDGWINSPFTNHPPVRQSERERCVSYRSRYKSCSLSLQIVLQQPWQYQPCCPAAGPLPQGRFFSLRLRIPSRAQGPRRAGSGSAVGREVHLVHLSPGAAPGRPASQGQSLSPPCPTLSQLCQEGKPVTCSRGQRLRGKENWTSGVRQKGPESQGPLREEQKEQGPTGEGTTLCPAEVGS